MNSTETPNPSGKSVPDATYEHMIVALSDYEEVAPTWLWPQRFEMGELNLVVGMQGVGKGIFLADVIMRLTRPERWADGAETPTPGKVILCSAEDSIEKTLKRRLRVVGADQSRVHVARATVNLADDKRLKSLCDDLEALLSVSLIILDPLKSYLGGVRLNDAGEVRLALGRLCMVAALANACLIGVLHFNKDHKNPCALHRVAGSGAFTEMARTVHFVLLDESTGRRIVACRKHNNCRRPPDLSFALKDKGGVGYATDWRLEDTQFDVEKTLSGATSSPRAPSSRERAEDFVKDYLAKHVVRGEETVAIPSAELYREAKARGLAKSAVEKAVKRLGGVSERPTGTRNPHWNLRFPCSSITPIEEVVEDVEDVKVVETCSTSPTTSTSLTCGGDGTAAESSGAIETIYVEPGSQAAGPDADVAPLDI